MEATEKNFDIVERILDILAEKECTVRQSEDILRYVASEIRERSTVQCAKGLSRGSRRRGSDYPADLPACR